MKRGKGILKLISMSLGVIMTLSMVLVVIPPIQAKAEGEEYPCFTKEPESVYLRNGEKTAIVSWETNFTPVKLLWVSSDWDGEYDYHEELIVDPTITSAELPCSAYTFIRAWYEDEEFSYVETAGFGIWDASWQTSLQDSLTFKADGEPRRVAVEFDGDDQGQERIALIAHGTEFVNVNDASDRVPMAFFNKDGLETVNHLSVGGNQFKYSETAYGNRAFGTVAGVYQYVYVDGFGTEREFAALQSVLAGKIVICNRGGTSFYEKANSAVEHGAAGIIVVNNTEGVINMNLTNYSYDKPVVSITMADGKKIKEDSVYVSGAQPYYTGVMEINAADVLNAKMESWSSGSGAIGFHVGVRDWNALTPGAKYKATISYETWMNNASEWDQTKQPLQGGTEVTILVPAGGIGANLESRDMYRLYNPNSGEHFYTASIEERDMLTPLGWRYEGIAWRAPEWSETPVYRLFNPNSGEHHYTTSGDERDNLTNLGWNFEGIGWYSDDAQGVPLHRLYNPNAVGQFEAGAHHYTSSEEEKDNLVGLGWKYEGIGWYGVAE